MFAFVLDGAFDLFVSIFFVFTLGSGSVCMLLFLGAIADCGFKLLLLGFQVELRMA